MIMALPSEPARRPQPRLSASRDEGHATALDATEVLLITCMRMR